MKGLFTIKIQKVYYEAIYLLHQPEVQDGPANLPRWKILVAALSLASLSLQLGSDFWVSLPVSNVAGNGKSHVKMEVSGISRN